MFADALAAWDSTGLTAKERSKRLEGFKKLIAAMLWVADRDPRQPQSGSIWGFLQHLLLMIGAHADARSFLLEQYPALIQHLIERTLATDDLENEFSSLIHSAGYKPTTIAALGMLRWNCC